MFSWMRQPVLIPGRAVPANQKKGEDFKQEKKNNFPGYIILNVCLVFNPDTQHGMDVHQRSIEISHVLNFSEPSSYELRDRTPDLNGKYSRPHCTLMHLRVINSPDVIDQVTQKLSAIVNTNFVVEIDGIDTTEAKKFDREKIKKNEMPESCLVQWLSVKKTSDLMKLQEKIAKAVEGKAECITTRDEKYRPHFTLWLGKKSTAAHYLERRQMAKEAFTHPFIHLNNFSVACKVVIGSCGPFGQVTRVIRTPESLSQLKRWDESESRIKKQKTEVSGASVFFKNNFDAKKMFADGIKLLQEGQHVPAIEFFKQILLYEKKSSPEKLVSVLHHLSQCYQRSKDWKEAFSCAGQAMKIANDISKQDAEFVKSYRACEAELKKIQIEELKKQEAMRQVKRPG